MLLFFSPMVAGENKKFIMIISVAGKKLCQHLRIIVQVEVWNNDSDELKLRVILDRFSAEIFINNGEQVMSAVIFTEQEAKGVSFFVEGAAKIDVVKYDLV